MNDDLLEVTPEENIPGNDPLHLGISDKTQPVPQRRRVTRAERQAIARAERHGWKVSVVGEQHVWLERPDGKSPGSIGIDIAGRVGYCPF